jgi:hypothetical protein
MKSWRTILFRLQFLEPFIHGWIMLVSLQSAGGLPGVKKTVLFMGFTEDQMFLFLLKKTFYDAWDNIFSMILVNLILLLGISIIFISFQYFAASPLVLVLLLLTLLLLVSFIFSFAAKFFSRVVNSSVATFKHIPKTFVASLLPTLQFFLLAAVSLTILTVAFNFYAAMDTFLAVFAMGILFWITVVLVLGGQYFFGFIYLEEASIFEALKKSVMFALDNIVYSTLVFLAALAILFISAFTGFLLPGPGFISILFLNGVKLRMLKYRYLQEEGKTKGKIPWRALLQEEKQKLGDRSLKGMIFPWKE